MVWPGPGGNWQALDLGNQPINQLETSYPESFRSLISSTGGNVGLQGMIDWSQQNPGFGLPGYGNKWDWRDDKKLKSFVSDEFGGRHGGGVFDKELYPIRLMNQTGRIQMPSGRGSPGMTYATYAPYGFIRLGDVPHAERAISKEPGRGGKIPGSSELWAVGGPGYTGESGQFFDPVSGSTFNLLAGIGTGDTGYVWNIQQGAGGPITGTNVNPMYGSEIATPRRAAAGAAPAPAPVAGTTPAPTTTPAAGAEPAPVATPVAGAEPAPVATPVAGAEPAPVATAPGVTAQPGATTEVAPVTYPTYQNLVGGWGTGPGGVTYRPGFNLPQPQYPVVGDRPTYSDYTNQQIADNLRAQNRWSVPGQTEGTFREREGWTEKSNQDVLDYIASQPSSWLQQQQQAYRPASLALMGQDINQRNEYLQRMQVADLTNLANQSFLGSMGMMQGYGQSALREVAKNYLRNVSRNRAQLAGRGMTGTTVQDAMMRGAGEQAFDDWLRAKDAITGRQIQTYTQGINGIMNALNSIQYRTMHPMEYANLYQAFGEGGSGAAAPEAPSTTGSALLGGALGIATPLLLNWAFGPVGGAVGAAVGGAGDLLGGVGGIIEDAVGWVGDIFSSIF